MPSSSGDCPCKSKVNLNVHGGGMMMFQVEFLTQHVLCMF